MNALHGDLGMISNPDLVIFLSKSGNTEELYQLAILLKERKIPTMGWFCQNNGKLVKLCDTVIYLPLEKELCTYDLSPTTSTIIQLIFGNTLAVDLMEKKNFSLEKYYLNHPSGNIGKKISLKVQDVMIKSPMIPICSLQQPIQEILVELSDKRCGCILVFDEDKKLQGIFTDGDLRRAIKQDKEKVFTNPVQRYMTRSFLSISPTATLQDAIATMQNKIDQKQVGALPVMQEETLLGLIRLHDIVALGLN